MKLKLKKKKKAACLPEVSQLTDCHPSFLPKRRDVTERSQCGGGARGSARVRWKGLRGPGALPAGPFRGCAGSGGGHFHSPPSAAEQPTPVSWRPDTSASSRGHLGPPRAPSPRPPARGVTRGPTGQPGSRQRGDGGPGRGSLPGG